MRGGFLIDQHEGPILANLIREIQDLAITRESSDRIHLEHLVAIDGDFWGYHHPIAGHAGSNFSNIYLRYRHLERVKSILKYGQDSSSFLEVGCGFGDILLELAWKSRGVIGIDVAWTRLIVVKARFSKLRLDVELIRADAHNLPFRNQSIDTVFSNQVIEHVGAPARIMQEKLRVARRRALLMSSTRSYLPGERLLYYRILTRTGPETVPNIGGYDSIHYLNQIVPPINSQILVFFAKILSEIPFLRRILAQNSLKVYERG